MIGLFLPPQALDVSKIKYAQNFIKIFDRKEYADRIIVLVYKESLLLLETHLKHLSVGTFGFRRIRDRLRRARKAMGLPYVADFEPAIQKYKITFAIFPEPTDDVVKCNIPYAASFQSLGHRLNPELSETAQGKNWKRREDTATTVCKDAKVIFIDSEQGKKYLKLYYDRDANVIVLEHAVPEELSSDNVDSDQQKFILNKLGISKDFLFYPAQFWPHKNHVRIVEAIRILKAKGIDIQVVFTGSNRTIRNLYNIEYIIRRIAKDSAMEKDVIIAGYLDSPSIRTLYGNALAMIMPQLIPEPCIPFAEAMGLGCPVIGSNLPGIREQIGNAGVWVDPYDVESIAGGIASLYSHRIQRQEYIKRGHEKYRSICASILQSFSSIEKTIIAVDE